MCIYLAWLFLFSFFSFLFLSFGNQLCSMGWERSRGGREKREKGESRTDAAGSQMPPGEICVAFVGLTGSVVSCLLTLMDHIALR